MKRNLYKRERLPARKRGVFAATKSQRGISLLAPIALPDASVTEVKSALFVLAKMSNITIGSGSGYDALKDKYFVVGMSRTTKRKQDTEIEGAVVAEAIRLARALNGGAHMAGALV